jgi:hypothetical protein
VNKRYNIIIIIHIKKRTLGEALFFLLFNYSNTIKVMFTKQKDEIWEIIPILHLYNPIHSITSTKSYQWVLLHVFPRNK